MFDGVTGNKTSGRPIFSKYMGKLFGLTEIIDMIISSIEIHPNN